MTREEAKFKIVDMYFKTTEYYGQDFEEFITYIYDSFEARIAELEDKNKVLEYNNMRLECELTDMIEDSAGENI